MEQIVKECQNIEWKESWNDDYLKWICAFANTEDGSLYIGIDDKGNVFPLKNEKKLLEDLPNKIRDVLGIIADVRLVSTDKDDYIRIDVPAYPNLINYHDRFYYRSGSTTQELKGADLQRMIMKKQGITWDTTQEPKASLDLFKSAVKRRDRMPDIDNETMESILEHLRFA